MQFLEQTDARWRRTTYRPPKNTLRKRRNVHAVEMEWYQDQTDTYCQYPQSMFMTIILLKTLLLLITFKNSYTHTKHKQYTEEEAVQCAHNEVYPRVVTVKRWIDKRDYE